MIKNIIKKLIPSEVKRIVRLAMLSGDKYNCPFCNYNAKDLRLIGANFKVLTEKQVVGAGIQSTSTTHVFPNKKITFTFKGRYLGRNFVNQSTYSILNTIPKPI